MENLKNNWSLWNLISGLDDGGFTTPLSELRTIDISRLGGSLSRGLTTKRGRGSTQNAGVCRIPGASIVDGLDLVRLKGNNLGDLFSCAIVLNDPVIPLLLRQAL